MVLLLGAIVLFISLVYHREATPQGIVIDDIVVSSNLAAKGETPKLLLHRFNSRLLKVFKEAETQLEPSQEALWSDAMISAPDFDLPGGGKFPLSSVVRYLKSQQPRTTLTLAHVDNLLVLRLNGVIDPRDGRPISIVKTWPPPSTAAIANELTTSGQTRSRRSSPARRMPTTSQLPFAGQAIDQLVDEACTDLLRVRHPYTLALFFYQKRDPVRALGAVASAMDYPNTSIRASAYNLWGNVLKDKAEYVRAAQKFQISSSLQPNNPWPIHNGGLVEMRLGIKAKADGNTVQANKHFNKAMKCFKLASKKPGAERHPYLYWDWAVTLDEMDRYEESIKMYEVQLKRLVHSKDLANILADLGEVRRRWALDLRRRNAITLKPGSQWVKKTRDLEGMAIHDFKDAIDLQPKIADAYYYLGRLHLDNYADYPQAERYFWMAALREQAKDTKQKLHESIRKQRSARITTRGLPTDRELENLWQALAQRTKHQQARDTIARRIALLARAGDRYSELKASHAAPPSTKGAHNNK